MPVGLEPKLHDFHASPKKLRVAHNKVDPRVRLNDARYLTDLQGIGGIFEWCHHITMAKHSEVSALGIAATVASFRGHRLEVLRGNLGLNGLQLRDGIRLGLSRRLIGAVGTTRGVLSQVKQATNPASLKLLSSQIRTDRPTRDWIPRLGVFDQQMVRANL